MFGTRSQTTKRRVPLNQIHNSSTSMAGGRPKGARNRKGTKAHPASSRKYSIDAFFRRPLDHAASQSASASDPAAVPAENDGSKHAEVSSAGPQHADAGVIEPRSLELHP